MNILIYINQLLQEVTTGVYFCDISNSTIVNKRHTQRIYKLLYFQA